jgi:hypothetical protein
VLVAGVALVGEFFALVLLTPTCTSGDATPAVLGTCIGLTLCAGLVPAGVVGLRQRPVAAVLVGLAAALAPGGFLAHIASTPQSGFCF